MNRREAIKRASALLGGAASVSVVSAVMSGCKAPTTNDWTPSFLTQEQVEMVAELAECIIPKTDTPGAKDALVHRFVDVYLNDCVTSEDQMAFTEGLKAVNTKAQDAYGSNFLSLSDTDKEALLKTLDTGGVDFSEEEMAAEMANEGEDVQGGSLDASKFFNAIRELTVMGFFTSEIGAKQALVFDQIPGDYQGCIPYEEVGGAWAM